MKSIKSLREQYELITEKEDKEQRKLTTLVRAGLFDAKKLPMLKRALDKGADKMTPAEKKILIDLLDSLMNQVISSDPVYMKVKRNVQNMNEELVVEAPVSISDVPSIVVLKRKAVRVYPGGQQVGLYYSQQLDKYVTIPFGETGITEETELEEVYNFRRDRYRYRDDDDDLIDKDYTDLTSDERKRLGPANAARIAMNRTGSPISAVGAALLSMYLKKKYDNTYTPSATKKMKTKSLKNVSSQRRQSVKNQKKNNRKPSLSPTANVSQSSHKKSGASSGTMLSRFEESYKPKYKIVRKQQIDEYSMKDLGSDAADVFVPGVSAYKNFKQGNYGAAVGDLAIDAASIGAGILSGGTAYGPARLAGAGAKVGIKGATKLATRAGTSGARKGLSRGNVLSRALAKLKRFGGKGKARRKGRRDYDLDLGFGGGGGGGAGGVSNQPQIKTPVTRSKEYISDPNIVTKSGPTYAKDLPASLRAREYNLYTQSLQRENVEIDLGGNIFEINSKVADKFVNVYNSLNEANQEKMLSMMLNEETQSKVIEFVTRY